MDIEGFRQRELARTQEIEEIEEFLSRRLSDATPVVQAVSQMTLGICPEDLRWAYQDESHFWDFRIDANEEPERPISFSSSYGYVSLDARWFKDEMSHQDIFELVRELFYNDIRENGYDDDISEYLKDNEKYYSYAQGEMDAGRMTSEGFEKVKDGIRSYENRLKGIIAISKVAREKTLDEWFDYVVTEDFFPVSS